MVCDELDCYAETLAAAKSFWSQAVPSSSAHLFCWLGWRIVKDDLRSETLVLIAIPVVFIIVAE
jgi:hypothetical protein